MSPVDGPLFVQTAVPSAVGTTVVFDQIGSAPLFVVPAVVQTCRLPLESVIAWPATTAVLVGQRSSLTHW